MKRTILYKIEEQPLTAERPSTACEFLRARGYSRHLMTYLRHHDNTLLINGSPAFTNRPLSPGDELSVTFTDEEAEGGDDSSALRIIPNRMDLNIVYEDQDILVINKPPYLPVQPSLGHREWTLGNGVAAYFQDQGIPFVYRCVNRIDKNTSGLVLIAKNMASSAILYDAMKKRQIHRIYFTLVHGRIEDDLRLTARSDTDDASEAAGIWPSFPGLIDLPIARVKGSTIERRIDPACGKRAVTHFRTISYHPENDTSALLVKLETGRTHQIRVHMQAAGHPVVGDGMYGYESDLMDRQALHSRSLDFFHPINLRPMHFECPLPQDILSLMKNDPFDNLIN